jgi:hypothetical protein
LSWGLQHRRAGPNARGRVHVLEADIAGVEAILSIDFGDLGVSVVGEDNVDALRRSMLIYTTMKSQT